MCPHGALEKAGEGGGMDKKDGQEMGLADPPKSTQREDKVEDHSKQKGSPSLSRALRGVMRKK